MTTLPLPIQFLAAWIATWMARHQEQVIDYLKEENRVLREKLGGRLRLTDPERRRLAKLGHELGRKGCLMSRALPAPIRSSAGTANSSPRSTTAAQNAAAPAAPGSHPKSCAS